MIKKLKKLVKKGKKALAAALKTSYYCHFFYRCKIKKNTVIFESRNGLDVAGNIFYLLKELRSGNYGEKRVYLSVDANTKGRAEALLKRYNVCGVKIIRQGSFRYFKILATVNYIFTDTSLPRAYIKKDGQVYTNTWHGTPLKKMGKHNALELHSMGNIQRNLLFSDYLVYPNDYMREKMIESYNIDNLFKGEILCEGYPRNSVFFNQNTDEIKKKIGYDDKELFVYMPTWKVENIGKNLGASLNEMKKTLLEIDALLSNKQVMLLKLHPMVKAAADVSGYKHIKAFPEGYEPYEVLSCCDALVTDYSSVFFDYANTRKKIVLFTPDREQYDSSRGFYFPLSELPFTNTSTPEELVSALSSSKDYDDSEFINRVCTYDNKDAAKNILSCVLNGEKTCKTLKLMQNNKPKVLLYCGALLQNGITAAFKNLLSSIDLGQRDYYYAIKQSAFTKNPERLEFLPPELKLYSISSGISFTFLEALAFVIFYKLTRTNGFVRHYVERAYAREFKKHFTDFSMDYVVNFSGYDKYIIKLLQQFKAKKIIFVHSDMEKELASKTNQHRLTIRSAYREYDKVAVVTEAMAKSTAKISGKKDNIVVVSNAFDANRFAENSKKPIEYQKDSRSSVHHPAGIEGILNAKGKKFIAVGRYSAEKQHNMLIDAFAEYNEQNPDSYLIIIGGSGKLYNKTVAYANSKPCSQNIACLWSIGNPMPIVKKCDLFVLCSKYEALGLVMFEADCVGIPVICTEMDGPKAMLKVHGGTMVENSKEGLLKGFAAFDKGEVKPMNIDFEEYNKTALSQFENLFS